MLPLHHQVRHQIVSGHTAVGGFFVFALANVNWDIFIGQALQVQCNSDSK
jgi:hypothetical protein